MLFKTIATLTFTLLLVSCDSSQDKLLVIADDRSTANEGVGSAPYDSQLESELLGPDPGTVLVQGGPATEQAEPAIGAATITDLVLITGQSNALGSETTFDPVLDQPVDRFYAYTDQGWQPASLRQVWDLGWHPVKGLGDDPHNNFGFHFGKTVAQQDAKRVVGIILVTAPGEGISHWDADNFFFNKIRNKTLLALNDLPHKSGVDGILWHQGETDWSKAGSNDPDLEDFPHNDYYSDKLWQVINNFRSESWFADERPFICGETARSPINTRLNALNRNSDTWTACVPGEGLETYDEAQVHFSAESLRQLGANYAEVYLQMTSKDG